MSNIKAKAQKFAVLTLVAVNIFVVGGVTGAYLMNGYDKGTAKATQHAAQELLKSVPTAQAASK